MQSGDYLKGAVVNIKANDKTGYTFTGWTTNDGVKFGDAKAKETTFEMPSKAVTVTANYSKNSSGGSSSGGSSSGKPNTTPNTNNNTNTNVNPEKSTPSANTILATEQFEDVKKHWAKEYINGVVGRGLVEGITEIKFEPNLPMTREALVTALGRLSKIDIQKYTQSSFTDVATDRKYSPYIQWAYMNDIVSGVGNNKFEPERAITREEIAIIFDRYAKATGYTLPKIKKASNYADEKNIGKAYKKSVRAMQQAGIMTGSTGNLFNPRGNATRAEVSSMLSRYINLIEEKK